MCLPAPGGPGLGQAEVSQSQPGSGGFGPFTPICDSEWHKAAVSVFGSFSLGDADANAFVCGLDCNSDFRKIQIVLKF
jgi:hypothetical protein